MKYAPRMRVVEVIRNGESRFYAQYKSFFVWKHFVRNIMYRGAAMYGQRSSFLSLEEAQEFCERVAVGDTIKIHLPFSEPDLSNHPTPPPARMVKDANSGRMVKNPEYEIYRKKYAVKRGA